MTLEKEDIDDDTPHVAVPNSMDICSTSCEITYEEGDFRVVKHRCFGRVLTRDKIKECAWVKARLKFTDENSTYISPPPTSVDISRFYILITKVDIDLMPKDLIEDPQACIQFLYRMVEEGTLAVKLGSAFGNVANRNIAELRIWYVKEKLNKFDNV